MHPFFEPLSERDAMLLITTLTVGGRDELQLKFKKKQSYWIQRNFNDISEDTFRNQF